MKRYLALLLSLFTSSLLAIGSDFTINTYNPLSDEDKQDSSALTYVNVVSGSFHGKEVDAILPGQEALSVERIYNTSEFFGDPNKPSTWQFMPELWVKVRDDEGAILGMPDGSNIKLKHTTDNTYRVVLGHEAVSPVGIDAGKKSCKNIQMTISSDSRTMAVVFGDGTVRHYEQYASFIYKTQKIRDGKKHHLREFYERAYRLVDEKRPDGFTRIAEYHPSDSLAKNYPRALKTYSKSGKLVHFVNFKYNFVKEKNGAICSNGMYLELSDGQVVHYDGFIRPGDAQLFKVGKSGSCDEKYYYDNTQFQDCFAKHFITRVGGPEREQLGVTYYQWDKSSFMNKRQIKGGHHHKGKVKEITAPIGPKGELVPIYGFIYGQNETLVEDYFGNVVKYTFTHEGYIAEVTRFKKNGAYSSEQNVWGKSNTELAGCLLAKHFKAATGGIYLSKTYKYDSRGNVLQEIIWGNLSGKGKDVVTIGSDGLPLANANEFYVKEYTYSDDGLNLLLSEQEGKRATIYSYVAGTNLCQSKIAYADGKIAQRTFYYYNEDNLLVKTVVDNGSSTKAGDLEGVTESKIVINKPFAEGPYVTLNEWVEEGYYDLDTKEERIIHKVKMNYGSFGRVLTKEHFDANHKSVGKETFTYDAHGRLVQEENLLGHKTDYTYNASFDLIAKVGPFLDHRIEYTRDAYGRVILEKEFFNEGKVLTRAYKYDALSRVIAMVDECGSTTSFSYDELGRVFKKTMAAVKDKNGKSYSPIEAYKYDWLNREVARVYADGSKVAIRFNARHQPIEVQHPHGAKEYFSYYLNGCLKEHIDPVGLIARYTYDGLDRVIQKELYDPQGKFISKTSYKHNAFHLVEEKDAMGVKTTYHYNAQGQLISKKKANCETRFAYDALGRMTQEITLLEDGKALIDEREYDLLGRVLVKKVKDSSGEVFFQEAYGYDELGNKTSITSFNNNEACTTKLKFNPKGQPLSIIDTEGNQTIFTYNTASALSVTEIIEANGCKITEERDGLGRLIHMVKMDPNGSTILETYSSYDPMGRRVRLVEKVYTPAPKEIVSEWSYTALGQVGAYKQGVGTSEERVYRYSYDLAGRLKEIYKPSGVVIKRHLNAQGSVVRLASSDGKIVYQYTYNPNQMVVRVDEKDGSYTARAYDALGRITQEKLKTGLVTSYTYDLASRVSAVKLPDDSVISYVYSGTNLVGINYGKSAISFGSYDLAGKWHVCSSNFGMIQRDINSQGRVVKLSSPFYSDEALAFDAVGNLITREVKDAWGQQKISYAYNYRNELVQESGVNQIRYEYDERGKRVSKGDQAYGLDSQNNIISDETATYSYDLDGNLIAKFEGNTETRYSYDALGRLSRIFRDKECIAFYYDAFNRRVAKAVFNQTSAGWAKVKSERMLYDGQQEIGTIDKARKIQTLKITRASSSKGDEPFLMVLDGKTYSALCDLQGSVVALINDAKKLSQAYRYTAFGEHEVRFQDAVQSPWRFLGKPWHAEVDLVYLEGNFYFPKLGTVVNQTIK